MLCPFTQNKCTPDCALHTGGAEGGGLVCSIAVIADSLDTIATSTRRG